MDTVLCTDLGDECTHKPDVIDFNWIKRRKPTQNLYSSFQKEKSNSNMYHKTKCASVLVLFIIGQTEQNLSVQTCRKENEQK